MAYWTWEQRRAAAESAYAIIDEAERIRRAGSELTLEQERDLEVARVFAVRYDGDGHKKKTWTSL